LTPSRPRTATKTGKGSSDDPRKRKPRPIPLRSGRPLQATISGHGRQPFRAHQEDPGIRRRCPDQRVWEIHREKKGSKEREKPGDRKGFDAGRQEGRNVQVLTGFEEEDGWEGVGGVILYTVSLVFKWGYNIDD
jgi:hypothetical protein